MIVYGYAMQYQYTSEGTLLIQVRIPSIHGPMNTKENPLETTQATKTYLGIPHCYYQLPPLRVK